MADSSTIPTVLIVDDDPLMIRLLARMLAPQARARFAISGEDALNRMRTFTPDLILLDVELPRMSGTDLCREIKRDPLLAGIPVIFVTSHNEPEFEIACFELGAVDYVQKPVHAPVLLARVGTHIRLKRLADELRQFARIDAVTEVANRRVFDETLLEEWTRALRTGQSLSIALVDIDYFKSFNDHYGHQAGDACLREFACVLRRSAGRSSDLVARYGGEEFALLLPDTEAAGAQVVADNLLCLLAESAIPHESSPLEGYLSASIGLSTFQPGMAVSSASAAQPLALGASDLVAAADAALYEAKQSGRRRACARPICASEGIAGIALPLRAGARPSLGVERIVSTEPCEPPTSGPT